MDNLNFAEKAANKIGRLGLTAPAILLLEAHKPVAFIGSQFLLIAQPTLDLFLPRHLTRSVVDLLADPQQVEHLITCLETDSPYPSTRPIDGSSKPAEGDL